MFFESKELSLLVVQTRIRHHPKALRRQMCLSTFFQRKCMHTFPFQSMRESQLPEKQKIHTFKDLVVWQKAMDLVIEIYALTAQFPKEELYGITSQMKRAAVSIPSNIAEGRRRGTKKEFAQFLRIAFGSASELETQMEISKRLLLTSKLNYGRAESFLVEVQKMLYVIINKMPRTDA